MNNCACDLVCHCYEGVTVSKQLVVLDIGKYIAEKKPSTCQGCREKPSTGIMFDLCDDCWIAFESRVDAHVEKTGEKYELSDKEFAFMNEPFAVRKG